MTDQEIERDIVSRLVRRALEVGYSVTVFDGEEHVLESPSNVYEDIMEAMFGTGQDQLSFRSQYGKRMGWVLLIYGNGVDVISNYTDNAAMESLVQFVEGD